MEQEMARTRWDGFADIQERGEHSSQWNVHG
jgi:hypothetical protein